MSAAGRPISAIKVFPMPTPLQMPPDEPNELIIHRYPRT